MSTLDMALFCCAQGWPVLPLWPVDAPPMAGALACMCAALEGCESPGKHPACAGGADAATCDRKRVVTFWREFARRNGGLQPGLGIATGAPLLVIDLDAPHLGEETWSRIAAGHPRLDTVEALTGRGRHLYLDARGLGRIPCSAGRLGPGVDVRGAGGYVVAPPSLHVTGRRYAWEASSDPTEGHALAQAPLWLVDLARAPSTRAVGGGYVAPDDVIATGGRNDALARYACSLRARGVEAPELREAVERLNATACDPPLPAREVERIVRGVLRRYRPGLSPRAMASALAAEAAAERAGRTGGRYDFKDDPSWWLTSTSGALPIDPEGVRDGGR